MQLFLGFYNFYRCFIKDYSKIIQPLNYLTRKDQPFNFDAIYKKAFNKLKEQLSSAPLLAYFYLEWPLMLETNASDSVIAGIFS